MDFKYQKWLWLVISVIIVGGADQLTKIWASNRLARTITGYFPPPCEPDGLVAKREKKVAYKHISVIKGYWDFRYVENCGGVFGFLSNYKEKSRRYFFYITNIVASIFLIYLLTKLKKDEKVLLVAFSIIMGGAVGNATDRLRLGYVIDFIDWHIQEKARWPTFNVADIGITVGLILILFDSFFLAPGREKRIKK